MISNNITMDIVLDTLDKNALKNDLDSINAQVNFLSTTIDDFRNFFKESTYKESVSSKTIMESIKRLVFKQLKNQNIFIEFNEVTMHIYKNELIQVLLNLISNSKDALLDNKQKDKKIKLSCENINNRLYIHISDNGSGVSNEVIPNIFDPYFSTKKEKNGTGLGLYMSKTIVEEHLDGKLNMKNIDDGVTFTIEIPI